LEVALDEGVNLRAEFKKWSKLSVSEGFDVFLLDESESESSKDDDE